MITDALRSVIPDDIETMFLKLAKMRSEELQTAIAKNMSEIQLKQEAAKSLVGLINLLKVLATEGAKNLPEEVLGQLRKCGVYSESSPKHTGNNLELLIEKVRAKLAANNNDAQLDMVRLQALISKHNSTIESISRSISNISNTQSSIIGNLR